VNPPARRGRKPGDLLPRLATAAVGVPLLLLLAFYGPNLGLWLLLSVAAAIGTWEYYRMTGVPPRSAEGAFGIGSTFALLGLVYWIPDLRLALVAAAGTLIALFLLVLRRADDMASIAPRFGHLTAGIAYPGLLFACYILLIQSEDPMATGMWQAGWLLFPMAVIWSGDTGAYFAGHAFGKRRLAPRVSPGKTLEGALGGAIASVGGGFLAWWAFGLPPEVTPVWVVAFALPAALIGQAGDLCESAIKRSVGVKDSSRILYGHGGMLDRVDALLFAAPWFFLLKHLVDFPR
jgi:phosphatidate cytidylyltransferase